MSERLTPQTELAKYKKLILTAKQYIETPFAQRKEAGGSHILDLRAGNTNLVYIGGAHTNKPDNPLFIEIKDNFNRLQPDMVYIEGWRPVNDRKDAAKAYFSKMTPEEAMQRGESCFTLKLAIDAGADFESPEPNFSSEITHLEQLSFSHEDIFRFYLYRTIDQYQREHDDPCAESCIEYLQPYLRQIRLESGFDADAIAGFEKSLFSNLDITSERYKVEVDPIPWEENPQTTINEIARASSAFRDGYIFERIADGLMAYSKVLVVYGSAHAVVQEPALRALFAEIADIENISE